MNTRLPLGDARPVAGASRITGRGAILRSLRGLVRRCERYGEHRAATPDERRWTAHLADALQAAFTAAGSAPDAHASLAAYDRRRQRSVKDRARRTP